MSIDLPGPHQEDWITFLHWMKDQGSDANEIIYIVEKPAKYRDEYRRFKLTGEKGEK